MPAATMRGIVMAGMEAGHMATTVAATVTEAMLALRLPPVSSGGSSREPWPQVPPPERNLTMAVQIAGSRTAALGMATNGLCSRFRFAPNGCKVAFGQAA